METTTNTNTKTQTLVTDNNADDWNEYPKTQSVGRALLPVKTDADKTLAFINLSHPNVEGKDIDTLDPQSLGDAFVTVTFDQMVTELQEILETETDKASHLAYQSMLDEGELKGLDDLDEFITARLVVRALMETDQVRDHYMNDFEIRNDVWSGDANASHNEVMSNTCPKCFTIRSTSGGCACVDE